MMARTAKNSQERDKAIDNDAKKKYWQQQASMWEEAARRTQQEDAKKQDHEAAQKHQEVALDLAMKIASNQIKSHKDSVRKQAIERFKQRKASGSIDPKKIKRELKRKKAPPLEPESDTKPSAQKRTKVANTHTNPSNGESLFCLGGNNRSQYHGGSNHYGTSPDPTGRFHTESQRKQITALYRTFNRPSNHTNSKTSEGRSF